MAGSLGKIGYGVTIGYGATTAGPFTSVGEIVNVDGPEVETDEVDLTHALSPNTAYEFISGMIKGGALEIDVNYTKADTATVYALVGLSKGWKVTLADATTGSTWVCSGFLQKLGNQIPIKDKITQKWTIKINGLPTFTAGS